MYILVDEDGCTLVASTNPDKFKGWLRKQYPSCGITASHNAINVTFDEDYTFQYNIEEVYTI